MASSDIENLILSAAADATKKIKWEDSHFDSNLEAGATGEKKVSLRPTRNDIDTDK